MKLTPWRGWGFDRMIDSLKTKILSIMFIISLSVIFSTNNLIPAAASTGTGSLIVVNVEGMVTAEHQRADGIIVLLNTPGGLVTATLDILQEFLTSKVPVITYVAPQGAIAASAGTFILISGHIAVMSPGSTCGAAMPVSMSPGGDSSQAVEEKTINFLAGHMKSIAQERGRPEDLVEKFVTENLTLDYREALEAGVIDLISPNLDDMLEKIHGKIIIIDNKEVSLNTLGAKTDFLKMSTMERITHIISNPQVAFVLLLLGIYGLIIGFNSPGSFFPEVLGAISLILAFFGLGMFEVNILGALLIILGIILLIAEVFTPTYGVLAVGGIVSMVLGIIFLPIEPMMPVQWFLKFRLMAIGIGVSSAVLMVIMLSGIVRLKGKRLYHGTEEFTGENAFVIEEINPVGQVKVRGEIWKARAEDNQLIPAGYMVKVKKRKGMEVIVEVLNSKSNSNINLDMD